MITAATTRANEVSAPARVRNHYRPAFPAARDSPPAPPRNVPVSRNAQSYPPRHADGMVLRCLIVDDSPVFLKAARALLEREGISVTVALNSAEAFRLFDEVCPDVVLLDIDFGDESGFDLAQTLSRRARLARGTTADSHLQPQSRRPRGTDRGQPRPRIHRQGRAVDLGHQASAERAQLTSAAPVTGSRGRRSRPAPAGDLRRSRGASAS